MRSGTFAEHPEDPHVAHRPRLLGGTSVWPMPDIPVRSAASVAYGAEAVRADLAEHGIAVLDAASTATAAQLRALGESLGVPMPERAPAVQPYVEDGVVLNLVADQGHTADTDLAPFAKNFLSLHSEGSGRAAAEQPRHIVLTCVDPGDDAASAQTVLVPMARVADALTAEQLDLLSATSYAHLAESGPTIARHVEGRVVFSFRDFMSDPLEWVCAAPGPADGSDVAAALRALLTAMYTVEPAGVHWRPGRLVVIDNTFSFHGRGAGSAAAGSRHRHLRRVRVVDHVS
ncbi:TauD/TfdA family dioxygenase [Actinokineospora sp. G85]|uniref:TauD/TfdA family dioxygenase n=1 Tax=Actinokineospora sp. G85 TaxID=3406626 RepID=UPI003C744229